MTVLRHFHPQRAHHAELTSTSPGHTPPLRRGFLYEVEFHSQTDGAGALLDDDDEWSVPIRGRMLDARLQQVIAAAANGWVVERYDR